VVRRAGEILRSLEEDELRRGGRPSLSGSPGAAQKQLGLFQAADQAVPSHLRHIEDRLRQIDVNQMTPLEALTILAELKREAGE
jgi:DNA mismatch repair protein MutS